MNGYFSAALDTERKIVSCDSDCAELISIGLPVLQSNAWVEGAVFRSENKHLLVGRRGFVLFSSSTFKLFKIDSEEDARLRYSLAPVADVKSDQFGLFLHQIIESSNYMRVPLAFLSKDAQVCFTNALLQELLSQESSDDLLKAEIRAHHEPVFRQLFYSWDSGFSTIAQIPTGQLHGNILISPCWLPTGVFAGFRLEFQPVNQVKAIAPPDSLSNLPLKNPNPVIKFSSEGKLLFANDAARQIFGNPGVEVESRHLLKIRDITIESRLTNAEKSQFKLGESWFLLRFVHTEDESLIYFSEITEEHLVKEGFEQAFSQLTAIINSSRSSIILLSITRQILFFNQRARKEIRKYFGFELEEGIELPELDASISRTIDVAIQTAIDGKHQLNYELDFEYLPGKKIWFHFMLYPITNQKNEVSGVCLSIQNITRSKLAEQETERIKQFYESVINNLPSDIVVFDKHHNYLFLNPHAISDNELRRWMIGKTDYDFAERRNLDRSIADKRRQMFNDVVSARQVYSFVDEHHKNGKTTFVLRKYYPVVEQDEVNLVIGYGVDITPIKEAEQKLQVSESRFKGLFQNNPMLLFLVDENLIIQDLNLAAQQAFGFENQIFVGANFSEFISPEFCDEFSQKFSEALQLKPNQTYSCYCGLTVSDLQFAVEFTATPVLDDAGNKLLLLAGIDQTERLKSEEKLRASEEFNRSLVKEMPIPFAIIDWDKAVFMNDACRRLIGADENTDLSSQSLFAFVDPAYHKLIAERLQKRYAGENAAPAVIKIYTISGEPRFVEMQGGLMNSGGTLLNFVTFTDRTEETLTEKARKQAEEALVASEQKLSLLVASLPLVPYTASIEDHYSFNYLNERVFELIGFTADEILSQPGFWLSRIKSDDLKVLAKASQNFSKNAEATIEYRIRNAFEIDVWIRETLRKVVDPFGNTIGITGVFQDISNEKSQNERRRLIESTLFEISKEEISATESLYAFYQTVFNRLRANLGISGLSIWKASDKGYQAVESFHVSNEVAFERTQQVIERNTIDALLKVVNTVATDSRDRGIDDVINLNLILGIQQSTSLLISIVRTSADDNLLMLLEQNEPNFIWEYEHFNLISSLSELVSFNLEYFQRRDSDSKLREAYRLTKIGAWEIEPDKNRIYWSEAMFEFYGLEAKNNQALSFEEALNYIHPDDKVQFEQAFRNLHDHHEPYKMECRHVLGDGIIRYFEKSALAIPSVTGNILFMGVTMDITEKKLAEQEMQKRQRRNLILNAIGSAVSPATSFAELFGFFAEAFIKSAPVLNIAVYSDETSSGVYSVFYAFPESFISSTDFESDLNSQIVRDLADLPLNNVLALHENYQKWLVSPVQMPGRGRCYLTLNLLHDANSDADFIAITESVIAMLQEKAERIFAENKLRDLNLELTDTNLQLRQYSYIVSHNLRAPVANILGCLNLISDDDPGDSRNKILMDGLKISANAVDSILQDLNKILNIREDVGKQFEFIDFDTLLDDVMENLRNETAEIEYALYRDFNEASGMMAFKPYLLSIFQNLISNSFRYRRPEEKLELRILSKVQGHKIELQFIDNGRGIDLQKNRKRLFKLYERFHADVAGTGLGLNMVQEQARVLGGTIRIESEVDVGTKFILTFTPKV